MHSLSVRLESPESLPDLDVMPAVVPAMGRALKFEPDDLRVGVRVAGVVVDHEEPDECVVDDELDERVELREVL